MNVRDVINKLYGVSTYTASNPLNTTLQQTPTAIWSNDPGTLQMTIINTGTKDMMIWVDESVSATKGILIAASGGSYEIDVTRFMLLPGSQWFGVGINGTTTIAAIRQNILS